MNMKSVFLFIFILSFGTLCFSQGVVATQESGGAVFISESSESTSDQAELVGSDPKTSSQTSTASASENYNINEITKAKSGCEVVKECQDVAVPRLGTRRI